MKYLLKIAKVLLMIFLMSCSQNFLDYTPKAVINGDQLTTPEDMEKLVIASYALMGSDDRRLDFTNMWRFGSVRSDDAYKGGGSVADGGPLGNALETFYLMQTDIEDVNAMWIALYEGVGRANEALKRIDAMDEKVYPNKKIRQAECRFIRGHFYFLLKILFKYPVWFDETTRKEDINELTTRDFSNDQLWDNIASDFQFGVDNLPITQPEIGRASKVAAWAYLAKVRLYQAYEQNEQDEVVNINKDKVQQVVDLTNNVINSGKYRLSNDFAENFLTETENGPESIFAIQYSVDDGTGNGGRLNKAASLQYNMAPQYGCCDFHNPSQNLVNSFKTNADGLPMFDTYNSVVIKDSIDFRKNSVDPRLDHTVGISTHPYKYEKDFIMKPNWRRAPQVYGYYSSMKGIVSYKDPTFRKIGAFFGSALNIAILRYDDVLLMRAEALIELGRHAEALPLINQIRQRAKSSTSRLVYANGSPVSNYKIEIYKDGVNCIWTQEYARKALRFERRLEFAMEGNRFFDLVRWGIAAETLNDYFSVEKTRFLFLKQAIFKKGRDEYVPIPQAQINLVEGRYIQNNGW